MGIFFAWLRARDQVRPRPLPVDDIPDRPARRLYVQFFCLALVIWIGGWAAAPPVAASQYVRLDYNIYTGTIFRHTIFVELFDDRPITTANFLQYVNGNKFDYSIMHRLVPGFVMQGGGFYPQFVNEPAPALASLPYSLNPNARVDLDGNSATANPSITNEFGLSPTRLNARGTLSMAQSSGNPNSATSQWFVNLGNNTSLDVSNGGSGPYTVFGGVRGDGMDYMDALISKLTIVNLNPDANDDGTRESGPFYLGSGDGTPVYFSNGSIAAVQIVDAEQIDYFGNGLSTNVDGSWSISGRNAVIDTGTVFTGPAGLEIGANRTLQTRENYSLGRDLANHGTLDPGLQIGKLTVNNYYQFVDGTLRIEIAGETADTQHDRIVATGGAYLAGKLDVNFVNGYLPDRGTTFDVINANPTGGITGSFTFFDLPNLEAGSVWRISRSGTAFTLTVAGGDYNRNGVVDMADYTLWRDTKGQAVTAGSGADGDENGVVNDNDYLVWRNNFGNVRGVASGSGVGSLLAGEVPEPGSVLLFLAGITPFVMRRGRQSISSLWL